MNEALWMVLLVLVVLAAVLGPVATLRYLAILERRRSPHRGSQRDPGDRHGGQGSSHTD